MSSLLQKIEKKTTAKYIIVISNQWRYFDRGITFFYLCKCCQFDFSPARTYRCTYSRSFRVLLRLRAACSLLRSVNAHGQLPTTRSDRVATMSLKELMLIFLWTNCLSAAPDKYYSYDLEAKKGGNIFIEL